MDSKKLNQKIKEKVDEALLPKGFKRKGWVWLSTHEDNSFGKLLHLIKSNFGDSYQVWVGFNQDTSIVDSRDSDIRASIKQLITEDTDWEGILTFKEEDPSQQIDQFKVYIEKLSDVISQINSMDDVQDLIKDNRKYFPGEYRRFFGNE